MSRRTSTYVLGIHDGHNCGATLTADGIIAASVNEERLSRAKNDIGYPKLAIEECLRISSVDPSELTQVVYASNFMHSAEHLTDIGRWYPLGLEEQRRDADLPKDYERRIFKIRRGERIESVRNHLGVNPERISFIEHHLAHLAAAYYTAPKQPGVPYLGLTCDGAGDGIAATVTICQGNSFARVAITDRHASLGKIYSRLTMLMGMTPWEHEYKLMGLAPYADTRRAADAAKPLQELIHLDPESLSFVQSGELSTNYCYEFLKNAFERVRFDVVAGAMQLFTEELLRDWLLSAIKRTGITDIVCGGGVFMNVKANMIMASQPDVTSFYVMPSAADESLSIGAALQWYYESTGRTDHSPSVLTHLYLGGEFDRREEEAAVEDLVASGEYDVSSPPEMNSRIADLLAVGDVVACARGRMEWGARALGNRSILAGADDYRVVDRINTLIKNRDFWMPFAPSLLEEAADDYLVETKAVRPWFMTYAFKAKPKALSHLIAGSHPRDHTVRPQVVTRTSNPDYHALISRFREQTGMAGILNTSFNLHGEPIVYSPHDAVRVFRLSGLQHLAMNQVLITKRRWSETETTP